MEMKRVSELSFFFFFRRGPVHPQHMQGAAMKQSSLQQQRKRMEEIGRVVQGNTAPPYLNSWVACCYLYLIFFKKIYQLSF
jgi:hypothetical protein